MEKEEREKVRVCWRERAGENLSKKRQISFIETVSRFPNFEQCGVFCALNYT